MFPVTAVMPMRCCCVYLVSLLTSGNRAGKRLLLPSVHAHGAEDGFGADGALRGPGLVAVRLLVVHLLLVVLAACTAREGQGRSAAVLSCGSLRAAPRRHPPTGGLAGTRWATATAWGGGVPDTKGPPWGRDLHLHLRDQRKGFPTICGWEFAEQELDLASAAGQSVQEAQTQDNQG